MFGKYKPDAKGDFKKKDTYVNAVVKVRGDVTFSGSFYYDGAIKGNIVAEENSKNELILGKNCKVKGDIHANRVIVFGEVTGSIYSEGVIILMPGANIHGDIYYRDMDMRHGASISGRFHHNKGKPQERKGLSLLRDKTVEKVDDKKSEQ